MSIEEEQLVLPTRPPNRSADRITEILIIKATLGIAVQFVRLADGIPPRTARYHVSRAVQLIRAALGDSTDLQAAGAAILGLVIRHQHLYFGDGFDVHLQKNSVVAGIHCRNAVHHDVVVAAAS